MRALEDAWRARRRKRRLSALLRALNDSAWFNPVRWPGRELLARTVGVLAVGLFVVRRILQMPSWPGYIALVRWAQPSFARFRALAGPLVAPDFDLERFYLGLGYRKDQVRILWILAAVLWTVETGVLLGYLLAFLTRDKARSVARGFLETAFPLLLAGLPFVIVATGFTYHKWFPEWSRIHLAGLYTINAVLILGGLLNVVGLLTMRRAFTIMCEARVLVQSGVYRWIRHPLYASHFLIYLCYTFLHLHAVTIALYGIFVAGQVFRARLEERKLAEAFPEYEEYRHRTGMFFPKILGGRIPL